MPQKPQAPNLAKTLSIGVTHPKPGRTQFVYRRYWQLDNAGLTRKFKLAYFDLMEECRALQELNLRSLAERLYDIPNRIQQTRDGVRKEQKSLQFSFLTKLASTITPDLPIYDRHVAKLFGFRVPDSKPFDTKLNQ